MYSLDDETAESFPRYGGGVEKVISIKSEALLSIVPAKHTPEFRCQEVLPGDRKADKECPES
jgi:hypothetical protein